MFCALQTVNSNLDVTNEDVTSLQYRYSWLKNGRPLDVAVEGNISQRPGEGTITIEINELQSHHDGEYQCIASNRFGRAVSVKSVLKRASECSLL